MNRIRVSGACLNQTPLDFQGNFDRVREAIQMARTQGAQLVCLPELCLTGYGCEDAFFQDSVSERAIESLVQLLPAAIGMVVCIGLPLMVEGNLYNVAAIIADGQLLGFTAKSRLASVGIYYEARWFKPWPDGYTASVDINGTFYPVGQNLYEVGGIRIAVEICEDAWAGNRPAVAYYQGGVDVILNPSASDFSLGKTHLRQNLVLDASRAFGCTYVYANLVGNEAGRVIYDGEILIASGGDWLARNSRFSYQEVQVVSAVADIGKIRFRRRMAVHHPAGPKPELTRICQEGFPWQDSRSTGEENRVLAPNESVEEEFARATALGLFDYLRKTRSCGFVLSLSGGADSAACLVLASLALRHAQAELGMEGLSRRLKYISPDRLQQPVANLITCIYQSTENNSSDTLASAQTLADELGAAFHHWDIGPLAEQYVRMTESVLGRTLTWETDDLALQNVQARTRVPALWMVANVKGALLITTSNRSESSVGYVTMDGDSSGGLAPLAGIDKPFIRHWLKWAQDHLGIAALGLVNALSPSAELKPAAQAQTDEKDLMPYEVLDFIESLWVGQGLDVAEITRRAEERFPGEPVASWVNRFAALFTRNQWKRERIAPSFHLDAYNLDPRSGYRYPILSGETKQ